MIINPSAHTMIPRGNTFRCHRNTSCRRSRGMALPGGKQLWYGVAKVFLASVLIVGISLALLNRSAERVAVEISALEASHGDLLGANILLRDQKARLFSPEAVGALASNQLAIHIPAQGQYRKL